MQCCPVMGSCTCAKAPDIATAWSKCRCRLPGLAHPRSFSSDTPSMIASSCKRRHRSYMYSPNSVAGNQLATRPNDPTAYFARASAHCARAGTPCAPHVFHWSERVVSVFCAPSLQQVGARPSCARRSASPTIRPTRRRRRRSSGRRSARPRRPEPSVAHKGFPKDRALGRRIGAAPRCVGGRPAQLRLPAGDGIRVEGDGARVLRRSTRTPPGIPGRGGACLAQT